MCIEGSGRMQYKLPIASSEVLGGIEVGEDFEIDSRTGILNIKNMNVMQQMVEDIITNIAQGKKLIANAITEKGIPTSDKDSFQSMAENIEGITGGSVVALTKTQYDALSNAEKNNGSVYQVTTPAGGDIGIISLLHFNVSAIADDVGNSWVKSSDANVGINTSVKKFGNASLSLNSAWIHSVTNSAWQFDDEDFTIDAWLYPLNNTSRKAFFCLAPATGGDFRLGIDLDNNNKNSYAAPWMGSNGYSWNVINGEDGVRGYTRVKANEWTHVALVRHGEYLTLYINGEIAVASPTTQTPNNKMTINIGSNSVYYAANDVIKLGAWGANQYQYTGYIDEFCVRNYAAWTEAFTPPTEPYEAYQEQSVDLYYMGVKYSIN